MHSVTKLLALLALTTLLCLSIKATAASDSISIIYPRDGQTLTAMDSSFIFGSVPKSMLAGGKLIIRVNGREFPVYRTGGFIAWVPLTPGEFTFDMAVFRKAEVSGPTKKAAPTALASRAVVVKVPEPLTSLSPDTLTIKGEYMPPRGNVTLMAGDMLEVSFRGTPGGHAWFSIPQKVDSIPMAERPPTAQPYWGEATFGDLPTPDTTNSLPAVRGIYTGYLKVTEGLKVDSTEIIYHLTAPQARVLGDVSLGGKSVGPLTLKGNAVGIVTYPSSYRITLNPKDYPFTVRFKDSVLIIRHAPTKGYFSVFQPRGVEALAVGSEGDWYKLKLSETQVGWVSAAQVERLPFGEVPPHSELTSIRHFSYRDSLVIQFPLAGMHPFRAIEDDRRTLRLQLFGVLSNTDWIRYDFTDSLVDLASWSQPEKDLYEFKLQLRRDIWGYDCYYRGTTFYLKLIKAPRNRLSLKGKVIVLDPGHSSDPGSIGPTGYTEAEANLAIALATRDVLAARGATVVMTRSDMSNVPLYDRPVIAKTHNATLFVSIHNNALPDGVNPFANFGVSTYYYNPHSIDLARAIQKQMITQTGFPDYGLYNGNLAVLRPPQYPAVLVECAFIILPEHEAKLQTTAFRRQVARAITNGIVNFLQGYNSGR